MKTLYLVVPLAPLAGSLVAGLLGKVVGRSGAHWSAIAGMLVSLAASVAVFRDVQAGNTFNGTVYTWATSAGISFDVGFLIDPLSALMMLVVTFVREPQGVPGESGGRSRFPARHRIDSCLCGQPRIRAGVRQGR
jgi:NADH-quinone oxidoreductase subunit L